MTPEAAGSGRVGGVSVLGRERVTRALRSLAAWSRAVSGEMSKIVSMVAGIEVWSWTRPSMRLGGMSGETTTAGTRGPYWLKVKPCLLCGRIGVSPGGMAAGGITWS